MHDMRQVHSTGEKRFWSLVSFFFFTIGFETVLTMDSFICLFTGEDELY